MLGRLCELQSFELLQAGLAGMKLPAGVMSDGDGSSGLAQPVDGDPDGLKMRVVADISHVLLPWAAGGSLPEIRSRPPRLRRVGFSVATVNQRDHLWVRGHDRAPRVVICGGGSAASPL